MKLGNFIEWERKIGTPIYQHKNLTVRPISRVLTIWWRPFGGSVRNWPVAIQLEEFGQTREIPIPNLSLWTHLAIGSTLLTVGLFTWLAGKRWPKIDAPTSETSQPLRPSS
jgi:hypothetical protein